MRGVTRRRPAEVELCARSARRNPQAAVRSEAAAESADRRARSSPTPPRGWRISTPSRPICARPMRIEAIERKPAGELSVEVEFGAPQRLEAGRLSRPRAPRARRGSRGRRHHDRRDLSARAIARAARFWPSRRARSPASTSRSRHSSQLDRGVDADAGISATATNAPPARRSAHVTGSARALLSGERTALNFLQHLSGIATLARAVRRARAAGRSRFSIREKRRRRCARSRSTPCAWAARPTIACRSTMA